MARKLILACVAVIVLAVAGTIFVLHADPKSAHAPAASGYPVTELKAAGHSYTLDVADTPDREALGLGKRTSLAADRGMLFAYDKVSQRCFWMKDMQFSIDIIWLDAEKRVTHIEPSLSPDTYPKTYCPDTPAQYVVELQAGISANTNLKAGDTLDFTL